MFGRKFFINKAVRYAYDNWDKFTDALSKRLGEPWGPIANDLLDGEAFRAADAFGVGGALSGEQPVSRRQIAHAILDLIEADVDDYARWVNNHINVPFVSEETEAEWFGHAADAVRSILSSCREWVNENL